MANSYFKFKQFTVQQDKCAMKVSTDACIQGAWTTFSKDTKTVLDIGTGTGLLSLMLAQRYPYITVDAIEIDAEAANQAKENFEQSAWNERLSVYCNDAKTFDKTVYDFIICNPPFFDNSLKGDDVQRNTARHTDSLSFENLFHVIDRLLNKDGYASIMLPVKEYSRLKEIFELKGWTISKELHIIPKEGSNANRIVGLFTKKDNPSKTIEELTIKKSDNDYTVEFIELMKPYYLYL